MEQPNVCTQAILPEPLHHEWDHGKHCIAEVYPPNRHPEWSPKVIGPYLQGAKERGVTRVFMPNFSDVSRRIVRVDALNHKKMGGGIEIAFKREAVVGGIIDIKPGEGAVVPTGGCINIILTVRPRFGGTHFVHLHGHRGLLIDQLDVAKSGRPSENREISIVEQGLRAIRSIYEVGPSRVFLYGFGALAASDFAHDPNDERYPRYQEVNRNLPGYLQEYFPGEDIDEILPRIDGLTCLHTGALVVAEAHRCGIKNAFVAESLPSGGERGFVSSGLTDERRYRRNLSLFYCPLD